VRWKKIQSFFQTGVQAGAIRSDSGGIRHDPKHCGVCDTFKAEGLLDGVVLIFEAGGVERSRSDYAGHHLPAVAAFARLRRKLRLGRFGKRG